MKTQTYDNALAELQGIVNALQSEAVELDELEAKSKRAVELLAFCRKRLRQVEATVSTMFEGNEESLEF